MVDVSTLPLVPMGATTILALVVLGIVRGALIPRRTYEDRMRDKDAQILYYQTALGREVERNGELSRQMGLLMEVGRTADHVLSSLPIAVGHGDGSRDEMASP
jgi:hypothetical protein